VVERVRRDGAEWRQARSTFTWRDGGMEAYTVGLDLECWRGVD
jgi:hypothetical protein